MAIEIKLPQFGMGMAEATVVRWHKAVGDRVEKGEVLVEVESAKALNEVLAPASGVLSSIRADTGQLAQVYDVLGVIGAAEVHGAVEVQATPRARRLAQELKIDLTAIRGSGPGGRITDDDVTAAAHTSRAVEPIRDVAAPTSTRLTGMRAAVARRMSQSLQKSAQLTLTRTLDVTPLVALRSLQRDKLDVGYSELILKAVAVALRQHPALNATFDGETVTRHENIDLGFAVALADGLIVPVIRGADRMSLSELLTEVRRLTEAARSGRITTSEVSGSTFTVTNLGGYEIEAFTPILNTPEVGILGVGRITEQFVKVGGEPTWRQIMTVSLTFDHQVLDGVPAAEFLRTLASVCLRPESLTQTHL